MHFNKHSDGTSKQIASLSIELRMCVKKILLVAMYIIGANVAKRRTYSKISRYNANASVESFTKVTLVPDSDCVRGANLIN